VSIPVEDEWDSPDTYWRARVGGTTLGRALVSLGHSIGDVDSAEVIRRSKSGRVREIRLVGERGSVVVSGRELRRALGESTLRSTMFELREGDDLVFVGSGNGPGVGMSLWGARAMPRKGAGYREILATFYPGTQLESVASGPDESAGLSSSVHLPAPTTRGVGP
jgi:stage II sporulation protein D